MTKRIISLLLTAVILSSSLTVLASDNKFDIELSTAETKNNISLDYDALPQITSDEHSAVSLKSAGVLTRELNFKEWEKVTATPEIPFNNNSVIEVPENITENAENGADYANKRSITLASDSAYRTGNMNSKDSFALQNQTGRTNFIGDNIGQEYIDPMTGNLIVTETDLILPGVDGLDLNLSRYYSLAQAELYTKTAEIVTAPKTYTFPQDGYIVTETVSNLETGAVSTYQYPYLDFLEAELRIDEIKSRDTADGLYQYDASREACSAGETLTFDYYYTAKRILQAIKE